MRISLNNKLQTTSVVVYSLFVIIQIILVVLYWNLDYSNDEINYIYHARQSYEMGLVYPSHINLYDRYIQAPGFVNYLTFIFLFTGVADGNLAKIASILLNSCLVLEIGWLAKKYFGHRTAYFTIILYCLTLSNIFVNCWVQTEVPFLFIVLSAFCLSLKKGWIYIICASALYAIAHTIRPLEIVFIIASVSLLCVDKEYVKSFVLVLSTAILIGGIGLYYESKTGVFFTGSTTGGTNLIMSANSGYVAHQHADLLDEPSNIAYIPLSQKVTFSERDSIYTSRSIQWISDNKLKYSVQYIGNMFRLWGADYWSIPETGEWLNYKIIKTMPTPQKQNHQTVRRILEFFMSFVYYIIVIIAIITLYKRKNEILSRKGIILMIVIIGTAITSLFPVMVRFHYPYLFAVTIWAAYGVSLYIKPKSNVS